jgi:predicted glycosyltransferase
VKIWIDLSNSPHPLLFEPIVERLEAAGHEARFTARDNAQTVELTLARWPDAEIIGDASPAGRAAKGAAAGGRIAALAKWARAARPDVALSHNSYAQIVAARLTGIRVVTAMDYEHQPANHLAFRLAHSILLPGALRDAGMRRMGATDGKTRFYDGLKEEIYLGGFEPDPAVLGEVGVTRNDGEVLVVARTPPHGALYHREDNPILFDILRRIGDVPEARCVVLSRRAEQREELAQQAIPGLVLPDQAVDARALMYCADLVVGAGGTMTREAALLGVPTVSIFSGRAAAADRWLEERGALRRLTAPEDLPAIRRRDSEPRAVDELRQRGDRLVQDFVDTAVQGNGRR